MRALKTIFYRVFFYIKCREHIKISVLLWQLKNMFYQTVKFCAMELTRRKVYHEMFRRFNSKITDQIVPATAFKMASVSKNDREEFNSFYPVIVKDLLSFVKEMDVPEITKWYPRMMEYNLLGGKQRRGHSVVLSYKLLEDPKKLTEENIRLANILGWSTELLTSSALMLDDVIDQSEMRRGVPCWYRVENVGFTAVTDAVILENDAYLILRKYFRHHPYYVSLYELFHETAFNELKGQVMDHLSSSKKHQNLEHFTMERYKTIALYKTGFAAFWFPVAAAMYLAGVQDAALHQKVASILQPMGSFVQVKNDFLDCFGNVDTHGATPYGDIREGICTWPAVVTLQKASPEQLKVMERCYGRPNDQSVQAVMDVYRAVDLPTLYANYEKETLNQIRKQIEEMDCEIPKKVFYNILEML